MKRFERFTNKNFAFNCLNLLKDKGYLSENEIEILTSEEECKRLFCFSRFSVLSEVSLNGPLKNSDCYDEQGRQRFYKEKIYLADRAFVVTNHWYGKDKSMPDNRTPFLQWVLEKIKR